MKTNYTYNIFEKSPIFDEIDTSSLNLYADCYANKKSFLKLIVYVSVAKIPFILEFHHLPINIYY